MLLKGSGMLVKVGMSHGDQKNASRVPSAVKVILHDLADPLQPPSKLHRGRGVKLIILVTAKKDVTAVISMQNRLVNLTASLVRVRLSHSVNRDTQALSVMSGRKRAVVALGTNAYIVTPI